MRLDITFDYKEHYLFQSTHPHGVRLKSVKTQYIIINVPIHAPTWGATHKMEQQPHSQTFQSTHPHGVRHAQCLVSVITSQFQSTHPHGVRLSTGCKEYYSIIVSIHAPTWGATGCGKSSGRDYRVSIHAPTWGATQTDAAVGVEHVFQSTHPHGVRQFNGAAPAVPIIVSIHAPTWGATQC